MKLLSRLVSTLFSTIALLLSSFSVFTFANNFKVLICIVEYDGARPSSDFPLGGPTRRLLLLSYIGYLGKLVVCWCSTDQGSVSTSTAESEVKAVNHTLKGEVISYRGILNAIGWTQEPTKIEEDNQACVYASESKHITRNLRHLDLAQLWFKEKVADGTFIIVKVDSKENDLDIETKRVSKTIFEYLTHNLIDKSLRTNI